MPASPERATQHPSRPPGARGRAVAANGTHDFPDARRGGLRPRPDRPHLGTYAGRVPVRTASGADPHPEPGECDELSPRLPLSPLSGAPPWEGRLFSGWWRDSFPTAAYGYAARSRITSLMWLRSLSSGSLPWTSLKWRWICGCSSSSALPTTSQRQSALPRSPQRKYFSTSPPPSVRGRLSVGLGPVMSSSLLPPGRATSVPGPEGTLPTTDRCPSPSACAPILPCSLAARAQWRATPEGRRR